MDAAWEAAKTNARERRRLKAERIRLLVSLSLEGLTAEEIAARVGASPRDTRRRCAELGVKGCSPGQRRAPAAWVKAETRAAIDALAAERGASAAEITATLLAFLFEDGAAKARSLLRHAVFRVVDRRAA